jgi:hypothetical protein
LTLPSLLFLIMLKPTATSRKSPKDWYRIKSYPHIGLVLTPSERGQIAAYVTDKAKVSTHAFSPFIHRNITVRKFRREICHDGTRSSLRKPSKKSRDIYYSNHIDSNIYSYYTSLIQGQYEKILSNSGLSECVTAYRQIKLESTNPNSRNKCNIDFANDVFSHIRIQNEDLVAIAFDIKSFFDNLDHKYLKRAWRYIMDTGADLPCDHYNVFRNITKFSFVRENKIFNLFQSRILVSRSTGLKQKSIKRKKYLRNKGATAYCRKEGVAELREHGLINANKFVANQHSKKLRTNGIPQGSPISATLANVYMFWFDQRANEMINQLGGIYRRYSDDMVVICDPKDEQKIIDFFMDEIKGCHLEIQSAKTQIFHLKYDIVQNRHFCFEKNINTQRLTANRNFEYLGFQFDGYFTLLKNSSLASYYRKMKKSIKRGKFHAKYNRTYAKGKLFMNRLYKRFTYLGSSRRILYKRDPVNKSNFILSKKLDWGNYLTYAKLASNILPDNKIKSQISRHWKIFHALVKS